MMVSIQRIRIFHLENTWLDYFPTEQYADEITDNTNASAEGKYYDFTRGNIHYFMVNNSIDYTMEGIETNAINQLDSRTTNELCAADTGSWSGAVTCKQYYWLKDKLENSNAPYKIVVMGNTTLFFCGNENPGICTRNFKATL